MYKSNFSSIATMLMTTLSYLHLFVFYQGYMFRKLAILKSFPGIIKITECNAIQYIIEMNSCVTT